MGSRDHATIAAKSGKHGGSFVDDTARKQLAGTIAIKRVEFKYGQTRDGYATITAKRRYKHGGSHCVISY